MEPPQKGRNHALPWFGRPVSEMALTTGKKERESSGGSPGKRKRKREKGSGGSRGSVATKRGSGESRGQKRANQRCNRRFFGVLPETRSTGETTRTKTDTQSILRDLGLWKRRNKQRKIGGNTRWKTTNKQKGKGEAQAPEEFLSNGVLSRSAGTPG